MPLLALFNVLPFNEYAGPRGPFLPVVAAALGFIAVGLYLLTNLFRSAVGLPHLSNRIFAGIVAVSLAVPLHWWLFFGEATDGSATGVSLFGGITIFTTMPLPFDFLLAKIVVAVLCVVLDLVVISEVLGLGWFKWSSESEKG